MGESVCRSDQPLISVIIPIYKVEPYLRKCVDSILSQTYRNLEVILVDDGSPDGCPEICDEYAARDTRVKVIHKENGGASSARNAALDVNHGEYILFVDADDYLDNNSYIDKLYRYAQEYSADVVVACGGKSLTGKYSSDEIKKRYYELSGFSGPVEKLYRTECVKHIRFNEQLPVGEDIIYNLDVIRMAITVYYSAIYGYVTTENPNSLTRKSNGKYDSRMDEEYQKWWGKIHSNALLSAGISAKSTQSANSNGCSVWIYQKIKNLCYKDCPHNKREIYARITRQLDGNKETLLSVKHPTSYKTYAVIRLCLALRNPKIIYLIFKFLIALGA